MDRQKSYESGMGVVLNVIFEAVRGPAGAQRPGEKYVVHQNLFIWSVQVWENRSLYSPQGVEPLNRCKKSSKKWYESGMRVVWSSMLQVCIGGAKALGRAVSTKNRHLFTSRSSENRSLCAPQCTGPLNRCQKSYEKWYGSGMRVV